MADSVDRVFGHALNTVNKIRPGSQKPPAADRLSLYGLYKQSMEGDVNKVADRPSTSTHPSLSPDSLRREQDKWDAWKANEGISKTEAKRRYIEKLIDTMQKYASQSDESRQLVEELEFVWEQVRSNSQPSGSDHSSPLQNLERSAYIHSDGQEHSEGLANSAAALGNIIGTQDMRILSPVSAPDEDPLDEDRDEFVDAPISQAGEEFHAGSDAVVGGEDERDFRRPARRGGASTPAYTWRKRVEASLMKLTTEIAALREQLESKRYIKQQQKNSIFGWVLRLSWWAFQLLVADAVLLWIIMWYLRKRRDRRLEGAIRVLLGDAVAERSDKEQIVNQMTWSRRSEQSNSQHGKSESGRGRSMAHDPSMFFLLDPPALFRATLEFMLGVYEESGETSESAEPAIAYYDKTSIQLTILLVVALCTCTLSRVVILSIRLSRWWKRRSRAKMKAERDSKQSSQQSSKQSSKGPSEQSSWHTSEEELPAVTRDSHPRMARRSGRS